jgi:amino acid transporter
MKIDVRYIIGDHLKTLRNAETGKVSLFDYLLFYAIPLLAAALTLISTVDLKKPDLFNVSITFFGIFIALLLNLQVAIFGILQRKWAPSSEAREQVNKDERREDRQALLSELNANLSYLVLVCCVALFGALVFFIREWTAGAGPAVMAFIYLHFLFTLVMVVKRSHVLFQSEYNEQA